jgi:hypothetical protein
MDPREAAEAACARKDPYKTELEALQAAVRIPRHEAWRPRGAYWCGICNFWHITSLRQSPSQAAQLADLALAELASMRQAACQ